jgi:hypothetical protein
VKPNHAWQPLAPQPTVNVCRNQDFRISNRATVNGEKHADSLKPSLGVEKTIFG